MAEKLPEFYKLDGLKECAEMIKVPKVKKTVPPAAEPLSTTKVKFFNFRKLLALYSKIPILISKLATNLYGGHQLRK